MRKAIVSLVTVIASFVTLTCSDVSDNVNLPIARPGYAIMLLNLGYPDEVATAQPSLVDRFFSLFTKTAHAQQAPPAFISSATVRVIGADFGVIEQSFTGSPVTIMALQVPAGALRAIEVTAYVSPTDPSAAISFKGSTVANLIGGAVVSVPVSMRLSRSKLVIPDYHFQRLAKIDNINGSNWVTRDGPYYSIGNFRPYDIDLDNRGRIYIANSSGVAPGVIRIDNMNTQSYATITATPNIISITVDRTNSKVYYVSSLSVVYGNSLNGGSEYSLTLNGVSGSYSCCAIDTDGFLYVGTTTNIYKCIQNTVSTFTAVASYSTNISQPRGILVKSQAVYIANTSSVSNSLIQLNKNLQFVSSYGTQATSTNTNPGRFYGAWKFVAILNDELTIIDNPPGLGGPNLAKLIMMQNGTGLDWTTFGSPGSGVNQFGFYNFC